MEYKILEDNKVLICIDCNQSFIFTKGEQEFYLSKKLAPAKRCQSCRSLRKQARIAGGDYNAKSI